MGNIIFTFYFQHPLFFIIIDLIVVAVIVVDVVFVAAVVATVAVVVVVSNVAITVACPARPFDCMLSG